MSWSLLLAKTDVVKAEHLWSKLRSRFSLALFINPVVCVENSVETPGLMALLLNQY